VEIGVWGWANLYVNPCSSTSWGGEAIEIRLIQLSRAAHRGHNIIGVMQRTYEGSQTPVIIHVNKYNSIRRNQYLPNFLTFKIWYAHIKIILTIEVVIIIFLNNFYSCFNYFNFNIATSRCMTPYSTGSILQLR
jgi:hypothetical protein